MAYTEFYCDPSTGNQMNGGSDSGSPSYMPTNGGWNSGTGVFTPTSGNPSLSVTVGQFASVFNDGATTPVFVGRVTAVDSTTVTVSVNATTSFCVGTEPTTSATGRSIRVGGAWKGPNAADAFPVGTANDSLQNASLNPTRINLKNNGTYSITAQLTQNQPGITYQGYSSSAGDGGKANIDGSTNAIVLFSNSGTASALVDIIFSNNGSSGTNNGLTVGSASARVIRCVAHDIRGSGFASTTAGAIFEECEAYLCNKAGTSNTGAFTCSAVTTYVRCIAHDNSASGSVGFVSAAATATYINCISDTNASHGMRDASTPGVMVYGCDFYNNGGSGINVTGNLNSSIISNCNFIKNTAEGVTGYTAASLVTNAVLVVNCGFGSGTQANSAQTSGSNVQTSGSVTYASNVTPWIDPANGDFRINLAAAIDAGRGAFTQTAASYAGASSSPVIGACQVADYPAVGNVNNGTTYANGAYTGTLVGGGSGGLIRPAGLSGGMQK